MHNHWWAYGVQGLIWSVAMSLVMGWLARSRKAPLDSRPDEARYPSSILGLGVVTTGLFGLCSIFAYRSPTGGLTVALGLFLFAAAGVYLIVDQRVAVFRVEETGLRFRTLFQGHRFVEWGLVARVDWSPMMKWFLVLVSNGRAVRLPAHLYGLPAIARGLLHHVPRDRFSTTAHSLLLATAAGNPPPLWH